jgi:hypothetical protein
MHASHRIRAQAPSLDRFIRLFVFVFDQLLAGNEHGSFALNCIGAHAVRGEGVTE